MFNKISDIANNVSVFLVVVAMFSMTVVVIGAILTRNFLGFSFAWTEELTRYLLIWTTFLGASVAFKNFQLVGFTFFTEKLPKRGRRIIILFSQAVLIIFISLIIYFGLQQTFQPSIFNQISSSLRIPMYLVYVSVPVGFLFMLLHSIARIEIVVREFIHKKGANGEQ